MRKELEDEDIKVEELPRITRMQGIIFEDSELLQWRKTSITKEWEGIWGKPSAAVGRRGRGAEAFTDTCGRRTLGRLH
jgi:hypothetical protein